VTANEKPGKEEGERSVFLFSYNNVRAGLGKPERVRLEAFFIAKEKEKKPSLL